LRVEIQGIEHLRARLEDLRTDLRAAAFKALKESAEAVRDEVAGKVRVDSGNLRGDVAARFHNNQLRAEIGWWQDDKYAVYLEQGTRRIPAKPTLVPALEAERNKIGDRIKVEVNKVLPS
jgi:HK97 gp10 family phage protein